MEDNLSKENYIKVIFSRALEELLQGRKLDDINTSEIISRSGLSRSTFYRYFEDKYALANWRYLDMLEQLSKDHTSPETSGENIRRLIDFIDENRSFFRKLLSYSGQNSFNDYYLKITFEWAERINSEAGRELTQKDYYTMRYHAAGILDILNEWLSSDDPISKEEFYEIIMENRSELMKALYTVPK